MKALRLLPAQLASCLFAIAAIPLVHAQVTVDWIGAGLTAEETADPSVVNPDNWSLYGEPPTSPYLPVGNGSENLRFGEIASASNSIYLPTIWSESEEPEPLPVIVNDLEFKNTATAGGDYSFSFSGHSPNDAGILLGGDVTVQAGGTVTIGSSMALLLSHNDHALHLASGSTLHVSAPIYDDYDEDDGNASISKWGGGTLVLDGQSGFSGGLTVHDGTLMIGSSSAHVPYYNEETHEIEGYEDVGPLGIGTLKFETYCSSPILALADNGSYTLNNEIDLGCFAGSVTIDTGCGDLTLLGYISGTAMIVKQGDGSLALFADNDFTGGVTVSAGKLLLGSDSAVGTGTLKLEAGTTLGLVDNDSYCLNNLIDLGCSGGLVNIAINGCGELALYGQISGSGGILKKGDGTLLLDNGENDFSGGVTVQRGTLVIGDSSYVSDGIIVSGPVGTETLKFEANCTIPVLALADNGCYILHNDIDLGCFSGTVKIDTGCGDLTLAGNITGTAGITKAGDGVLTLEGDNDFGDFKVNGGTVNAETDTALGGGLLAFCSSSGAIVNFNSDHPTISGLSGFSCNDLINLNGDCWPATLTIIQDVNTVFAGVIADGDRSGGSVIKTGCGDLTLSGQSTFSGGFVLEQGALIIAGSSVVDCFDNITSGPVGTGTLELKSDTTLGVANNSSYDLHNYIDLGCSGGLVNIAVANCGELSLYGQISGSATIVKKGNGTLALYNDESEFTGGVTVKRGTLIIGSSSVMENILNEELEIIGQEFVSGPVGIGTLKFEADCTIPTLALANNGCYELRNNIDLGCFAGTVKIDTGCGDLTLYGSITGKAGITKVGDGTLTLEGSNEFYGDFKVEGGIVNAETDRALGYGLLAFCSSSGAIVNFNSDHPTISGLSGFSCNDLINLNGDCWPATLTIIQDVSTAFSGVIADGDNGPGGSVIKMGCGDLTLSGQSTFTGGFTVQQGTLIIGSSSLLSEVEVDGFSEDGNEYAIESGPVGTGILKLESGTTLSVANNGSYDLHNLIDLGCSGGLVNIAITGCGELALYGQISGSAGINKTGTGTLTLEGVNNMSGDFYVSAGTVNANNDYALGYGALEFGILESIAAVNFNTSSPEIGGLEGDSANDVVDLAGVAGAGAHLTIHQPENSTFAGKIAGPNGSVTKVDTGVLTLSGQSTFGGGFTLGEGKLVLGSSTTLDVDETTILSGPVGLGTLKIEDGATLSALGLGRHLANPIDLSESGSVNFTVENSSSTLWLDGELTGSHDINKTGLGTVFINHDNSDSFTGNTHVQDGILVANVSGALGLGGTIDLSGGTLVANANGSLGGGAITLNGGGLKIGPGVVLANQLTLTAGTLSGNYTFNTPQTFGTGVTLSPGNSPGTMNFTDLIISNGFSEIVEIKSISDAPGISSDRFVGSGTLNLSAVSAGGYTLELISLLPDDSPGAISGLVGGESWTIFQFNTITGFLADSSQFHFNTNGFVGGGNFSLTLNGNAGAGQNLVLNFTPVPEPSTYALMALGLGATGLAAWRKRRRA